MKRLALLAAVLAWGAPAAAQQSPGRLSGAPPSPLKPAGLPTLQTEDAHSSFRVRPAVVGYTGDGTGFMGGRRVAGRRFGRIHWLRWNGRAAFGRGDDWLNDCMPDCAEGTYHPHGGSIRAYRPRAGHFTRIDLRFHYHGRAVLDRRRLVREGAGFWGWAIVTQRGF